MPSPMASATKRNSSSFRVRATRVMMGGTTFAARYANGTRTSAALPRAVAMARMRPGSSVPNAGISTIRTTTARSSTSVIPIMTRP